MPQSLAYVPVHFAFSTKYRQPLLSEDIREEFFPYLGGFLRNHGCPPVQIGGVEDHIHLLFPLPRTLTIAETIGTLKSESTKWIKNRWPRCSNFAWQVGYGVFGIGIREVNSTAKYIQNQKEHHKKITFQEEFLQLLEEFGIPYDPRYVWE